MSNLTMFDQQNAQLPAHLQEAFAEESNLDTSAGPPALTIRGKVFRINMEGEERALTRYDSEMEDHVPVTSVSLIVLNQGPFGARVYYGSAYNPDNSEGPKCFSLDGKTPDAMSPEPQATTCAQCPHAVKGSRVTENGAQTTSCTYQRRLSVVPAHKPDFAPLLLRLAPTSAYDPETKNAENGWFGWRQYLDFLNARGVRHTAMVVTKVRFDANAEHPKLLFRPERYLSEEEAAIVQPRIESEEVMAALLPSKGDAAAPVPLDDIPAAPTTKPKAAPAAEGHPEEKGQDSAPEAQVAPAEDEGWGEPAPAPAPEKPARKAAPKAAEPEDEEAEKPVRKAAKSSSASSGDADGGGIDALLDDWDA